ncbi:MAG: hypothetical protein J6R77_08150 [Clostridia bacterium]|nr:hypothetical protein [Clostridia bacterium]
MRYREFIKTYRRSREAATPAMRVPVTETETYPLARKNAKTYPLIWKTVAVAAVVALLVTGGWLWHQKGQAPLPKEPVKEENLPDVDNVTPPPPVGHTVHVTPALHAGTPLDDIQTADGALNALPTITFDYQDTLSENHETCSGVYYNAQNGTLFCCTHAVRELMKEHGISGENVRVKHFTPSLGKVLFTLDDQPGHPSYCGDLSTDTLVPVKADLYATGTWMGGPDGKDTPYALLFAMDDSNALWLIDLRTAEAKRLSDTYPAMEDATLSRDGQYVYYTKMDGNANTPARTTVLYTPADGTYRTFTGEVLDSYLDDSLLIVRTPEGVQAYNCTTGQIQPVEEAGVAEEYLYGVRRTHDYTPFAWKLGVEDYRTGEVATLDVGYVEASLRSEDRRYLYYYCRGEEAIRVWDLVEGKETTLPIDPKLVAETEGEAAAGYNVAFTLSWSHTNNAPTLLLQYVVTGVPRQDPEAVQQETEGSAYYQYYLWYQANPEGTIVSMGTLLERFADRLVAYEGEGFLYLDYTDLLELTPGPGGERLSISVLLEDYRSGYVYNIGHTWGVFNSPFYCKDGYALPVGAEIATRAALTAAGVKILPDEMDYGPYFKNGKQNALKSYLDVYHTDNLLPQVNCFFLFDHKNPSGDTRWGLEDPEDMAGLERLLRMSDTLSYTKHMGNTSEYVSYQRACDYYIDLSQSAHDRGRILIGRKDGKPFLVKGGCLATLTEEQYKETVDWLAEIYPKSFVDPYAGY